MIPTYLYTALWLSFMFQTNYLFKCELQANISFYVNIVKLKFSVCKCVYIGKQNITIILP